MMRQLMRVLLIGLAFYFVFPLIPGIHIHGGFVHILVAAAVFAFLGWLVEVVAIACSAVVTISTLGLALLILIPLWTFGFWLLPALALKMLATFMPASLTINGWTPAILGGLVMLVIGIATGGKPTRYRRLRD